MSEGNRKRSNSFFEEVEATFSDPSSENEEESEEEEEEQDSHSKMVVSFYDIFLGFMSWMDIMDVTGQEDLRTYVEESEENNEYFVKCITNGNAIWKSLKDHEYWEEDPSIRDFINHIMCEIFEDEDDSSSVCEYYISNLRTVLLLVEQNLERKYSVKKKLLQRQQARQKAYERSVVNRAKDFHKNKKKRKLTLEDKED